jgi:gamma-glutamylcyclotransferase (GGCT)/AIG2-like uncharacterized protein YtfP
VAGHVFTYGTLLVAEVMEAVAGARFASVAARLDGFERVRVRDAVYPAARAADAASIDGVLWLDVSDAALLRLDRFEGEMYERRDVRVSTAGGSRDAQVYVVTAAHHHLLDPAPWDLALFRREHLARYLEHCRGGDVAGQF